MSTDHQLQFHCIQCNEPVAFSLMSHTHFDMFLDCEQCGKKYCFDDATIIKQLKQFEALCRQIHASKEILGSTAIAIDVGNHHVKVPFNILLTRLNSVIDLVIGDHRVTFFYRIEPLKEEIFSTTH